MKSNHPPASDTSHPAESLMRGLELRFALTFLLLFAELQYGYSACQGSIIEHWVLDVATVRPSAAAINFIFPEIKAQALGHKIVSQQGSLSVLNGCEGTETLFMLVAAILAFNTSWRHKLKGLAMGVVLIYGLNQIRIVALFFAAQQNRKWFELLHGTLAPTLIIVLSVLFFMWWSNTPANHEPASTT
jgi:exosortase family protein XrtM